MLFHRFAAPRGLPWIALAVACAATLALWAGAWSGGSSGSSAPPPAAERVLTDKLARFDARLTRLELLGDRLITLHALDERDFDLPAPPAGVGGAREPLAALQERLEARELRLGYLRERHADQTRASHRLPQGWPVERGSISSPFGARVSPFTGRLEMHQGIDIRARPGSQVRAVAAGVVTAAHARGRYGLLVEIDHGDGYRTRYAHNRVNLVEVGDLVEKGEAVALLGNTGRSTGPHLHFEVLRNGRPVDPRAHLGPRRGPR